MIRIAVCDDSSAFLNQTGFMIGHWDAPAARDIVTELFTDGDSLLAAHAKNPFDIILLDIVMPLLNGIEAAREIRETDKTVKIVFLTSSPEFAVDSYSVKASNYLLKPVNPDSLFACLTELVEEIRGVAKCIAVKGIDAAYRLLLSDIAWIESQRKHIVFFLGDGRMIRSTEPLYAFENALQLEDGFYKCHRSYIVNIHHIDTYSHAEIIMRAGQRIPISRSFQKSFESAYFYAVFGKAGDVL